MSIDAAAIRAELTETRDRVERRDDDIARAADAGISKTEIAKLTGLSRQHIHTVLARHAEAQNRALGLGEGAPEVTAGVKAMWKLGQVVEDRWGLRWRADVITNPAYQGEDARRWQCRSVGLRLSVSHARMAVRGPLKAIRLDKVFAGPWGSEEQKAAVAARKAGEVDDAAVVVEPHEDTEEND